MENDNLTIFELINSYIKDKENTKCLQALKIVLDQVFETCEDPTNIAEHILIIWNGLCEIGAEDLNYSDICKLLSGDYSVMSLLNSSISLVDLYYVKDKGALVLVKGDEDGNPLEFITYYADTSKKKVKNYTAYITLQIMQKYNPVLTTNILTKETKTEYKNKVLGENYIL